MGLGEKDLKKDLGGDVIPFMVSCSICLEVVRDKGDRSTAKLQCGHEFHLDCIGSAFNAKGAMQCPNCRKVEKGQWLYASGHHRSITEFSMEDWTYDEDLYESSYSEMPFVHWCPYSGLARLTSFEEGEATTAAYHDFLGHHSLFAEPTPASSAAHSCPYMPYFQPLQPSSSSSSSAESVTDGHTFHRWASSRMNAADQAPVSSAIPRSTRADSDGVPRAGAFTHPFFLGHGSTSRAGSSVVLPQFLGNSQAQGRGHGLHSYHQQPNSTAVRFSSMRRSAGPRGSAPIGSMHSADHPGVFLVPSGSSGQNLVDAENSEGSRFYAWERDRFAPYPLAPVDSESNWWGQFHHVAGGSDSSSRTPFWHRHGTERQSSQGRTENPYQSSHAPRLHPFI
ncbi:hypothetical protein AAC387_Pa03g2063 [Persea americana]